MITPVKYRTEEIHMKKTWIAPMVEELSIEDTACPWFPFWPWWSWPTPPNNTPGQEEEKPIVTPPVDSFS